MTKCNTVVMGTNTLLSLPGERPLTYMKYLLLSSSLEKDGLNGFVVASILDEIKAVLSGIYNG